MTTDDQPQITVSLIVAIAKNHVIGDGDKIPWHIPEDFKYFKTQTLNKPIIMGRATFESIHSMRGGNPSSGPALPKRKNIIITRQDDYTANECIVCSSLEKAIEKAKSHVNDDNEIMIIGGGQIYKQSMEMDLCNRMYITIIDREPDGDVFFPQWDNNTWELTSSDPQDGYCFNIFDKR